MSIISATIRRDQDPKPRVPARHRRRRDFPVTLRSSAAITWCVAMFGGSLGCILGVGAIAVPVALVLFAAVALVPDRGRHR